MKRILFVLGVLGVMGLASSYKQPDSSNDGCDGGSRVCCVNNQVNFG